MIHILKSAKGYRVYNEAEQKISYSLPFIKLDTTLVRISSNLEITNLSDLLNTLTSTKLLVSVPTLEDVQKIYPELFV